MATIQFENGMRVNFDGNPTPQDIEEVAKKLGINKTPAPTPAKKGVGGLGGVAVGAAKGIGSTLAGAAQLGEKGLAAATRGIGSLIGSKNLRRTQADTLPQEIKQRYLTPEGTAEKIGFGAEQVAEFFAPVPGGAKAKLLLKATEKAKPLVAGAKALGRVGTEAIEAAGKGAIQKGSTEQFGEEAAAQAGFSAVLGVIAPLAKTGAAILGKTTGAGGTAIREAFGNPNVRKFIKEAAENGPEYLQEQALREAKNALGGLVKKRETAYLKELNGIKSAKGQLTEIKDNAVNLAREAFENAAVKISKKGTLGINAFKDSAVEQGKNSVIKAFRTLSTWADNTPAGLDRLKKRLNQFKNATRNTTDGSYALIRTMANSVDDGLKANVPGYLQMTSGYRVASESIDEIERALSLGGSAAKETAIKKLMGSLRENNETRLAILEKLQGGKDIVGKLAGAQLSPLAPKGLAGSIFPTAGSAGAFQTVLNPTTWPLLVTYLMASSPRLVGEATALLGNLSRGAPIEQIVQALRGLLSQAFQDAQNDAPSPSDVLAPR